MEIPQMEQERPITLREQELLDRGQHLAQKLAVRDGLVEAKKAEAKKRQDEIDDLDEEISELAQGIRDGFESRKQGDLFVDQALSKDDAAQRLAEIAKRAGKHPFVPGAGETCAREGCGILAGSEVHVPPPPSEPHTFEPDAEGKCWACGSGADDPVHGEFASAAEMEGVLREGLSLPSTIDCSRCSKPVPKSEVLYDREVLPVCETCKRAAINLGTWPHVFRAKSAKAKRCGECPLPKDDAVHVEEAETPPAVDAETTPGDTPPEESVAIAKEHVTGDPAYDFPADEPAPNVISTHRAIDEALEDR